LALEARAETALGSHLCSSDHARVTEQLATLASAPGARLQVVQDEHVIVGMMLARVVGPTVFLDEVALFVEAVYVGQGQRRRGAGHALLEAATDLAEEVGAASVYAVPLPGARGMQRFLARLGFAPAAAHRVVPTAVLRRRLTEPVGLVALRRRAAGSPAGPIARRRQVRDEGLAPVVGPVAQPASVTGGEAGDWPRSGISRHVRRAVQTRLPPSSRTSPS